MLITPEVVENVYLTIRYFENKGFRRNEAIRITDMCLRASNADATSSNDGSGFFILRRKPKRVNVKKVGDIKC